MYVEVVTAVVFKGNDKFRDRAQLTRAVRTATLRAGVSGRSPIVMDAEGDCPARLGPRFSSGLRRNAVTFRSQSLWRRGSMKRGFWPLPIASGTSRSAADLAPPPDPEAVQGAQGVAEQAHARNQPYSPTSHQASFSQVMSLDRRGGGRRRSTSCAGTCGAGRCAPRRRRLRRRSEGLRSYAGAVGSAMWKALPTRAAGRATSPRWARTIRSTIARPRPIPVGPPPDALPRGKAVEDERHFLGWDALAGVVDLQVMPRLSDQTRRSPSRRGACA